MLPTKFYVVADALRNGSIVTETLKVTYLPDHTAAATATQVLKLSEVLDDNDDTANVHLNFDIPKNILVRLSA